ncbi:ferritin-like protein [Massilia violaceinigra]|uniref:Ferritin-like protein n=1 Tax=Massilia violaceinigra TaxID=2045208 RepID=A0ABY4A5S3_9BURK|nr:ferritin-like protein [Massilia violaceinigra]UOD30130.1 ferritin-like protein [Massilia violaceinigra]
MIHLQRERLRSLRSTTPTLADVRAVLQDAIELEHATIPVYLYALYSLDPSKNGAVAAIIESVVMEEMLHMLLVANVLNAIGGQPDIAAPGFVPRYPGPLPGDVEGELIVHLAPFSQDQLSAFLTIEQPENPLVFKHVPGEDDGRVTIGEFYAAISASLARLDPSVFSNTPRNQVGPDLFTGSIVVTDLKSAQAAINLIVEQGEGTSTSPEEAGGGGFAHYYRFMQIRKGHALVKNPGVNPPQKRYSYSGAPISIDPDGVYALPTNPKSADYPDGSAQRYASDRFNYTYTALLNCLHCLFGGEETARQLDVAVGLMMSLKGQAKAMASGVPNPAIIIGPSFEYQAGNPPGPA